MDKNEFYKELENVPPLPEGVCDRVLRRKRTRVMPYMVRSVAALLVLGVALIYRGTLLQDKTIDSYVEIENSLEESFSYLSEVYDDYDLLSDL